MILQIITAIELVHPVCMGHVISLSFLCTSIIFFVFFVGFHVMQIYMSFISTFREVLASKNTLNHLYYWSNTGVLQIN